MVSVECQYCAKVYVYFRFRNARPDEIENRFGKSKNVRVLRKCENAAEQTNRIESARQIMKIFISGYHNPSYMTVTEYIERGSAALGHRIYAFDDRKHIFPGRLRRKITVFNRLSVGWINRSFCRAVAVFKPDIILVTGGTRILESTVRQIANQYKSVLWTTDAPANFENIEKTAKLYDYVFCQGTEAIELLSKINVDARWLPMACDPNVHRTVPLSKDNLCRYSSDIAFVGSLYQERANVLRTITDFDLGIWGPGWDRVTASDPLKKFVRGGHTEPKVWRKIYSAAQIVLSVHCRETINNLPVFQASPRVFEAMACGAFVLTDDQRDVAKLFTDGEHLAIFSSTSDLRSKLIHYLKYPDETKKIALAGQEKVLCNHTYKDRLLQITSLFE